MRGNVSKVSVNSAVSEQHIIDAADTALQTSREAKETLNQINNVFQASETVSLQSMYNEVIEPSPEEWFTFDSETQAITGLNVEYEDVYSSDDVIDLVIPYSIGGVIVKRIGSNAFSDMMPENIQNVRLPNCITHIGREAFFGGKFMSINIPTSCMAIESNAFRYNERLHEVITPIKPNWEILLGAEVFYNCKNLNNIDSIINGVKTIPYSAFYEISAKNVVIPESVDSLAKRSFYINGLNCFTVLNKDCVFDVETFGNMDDNPCFPALIKGYKGSTAETYAKNNGIPFMSIEGTEVLDKADKSDTYTKTESDKKLYTKADRTTVYTIAETDTMLSSKADKADTDKEFDEVKENHSSHVLNNDCHFMYGEREEINQRISDLQTTKADKADTYTKTEVDKKLETKADEVTGLGLVYLDENYQSDVYQECCKMGVTNSNYSKSINCDIIFYDAPQTNRRLAAKADKSEFDWVFLGECKLSETAHFLTIDLGNTIETEWYKETLMLVEIPAYTNQDNGSFAIRASVTESGGLTNSGTKSTIIATYSKIENLGALSNGKKNNLAVKTQWINNSPVITNVTRQRGDGKAYSQYSVGTTNFSTGESIIGSQYITLVSLDKELFVFPAKSKISLYGRLRYEI